ERRELPPQPRPLDARHHALPAAARLHRPRRDPRPLGRSHREVRRQDARQAARGRGLRRGDGGGRVAVSETTPSATGLEARPRAGGPAWLTEQRARLAEALERDGFPTQKTEAWRFTPA